VELFKRYFILIIPNPPQNSSISLPLAPQMNSNNELLDDISRFGPQQTSLFTDLKGHQGDIIRETGSLLWLTSIYKVDLSALSYHIDFNTNLQEITKQIMDNHNSNYKL
jgi:hypothetical protein